MNVRSIPSYNPLVTIEEQVLTSFNKCTELHRQNLYEDLGDQSPKRKARLIEVIKTMGVTEKTQKG